MPELPEVETVRRCLDAYLVGRRIRGVEVLDSRLRRPVDPDRLRAALEGHKVTAVERRAKYLILRLDGPESALVHLGMSGRIAIRRRSEPRERHTHIVLSLERGWELRFRDHRRFGLFDVVGAADLETDPRLAQLGVEPLSRAFSPAYLFSRSRGLRRPIKALLMDAGCVAGIGNIYANEALYEARIRPRRPACLLSREEAGRIVRAVKSVLRRAIRRGGTTLADYRTPTGEEGYFRIELGVYGREGESCRRCGTEIRREILAGRSSFFCPSCQVR